MFTDTFVAVLVASFLACAVTTAGIWAIGRYAEWASHNAVYFMSFAAGVLIAVSFTHVAPESFEINEAAPIYLLAGFLGLLLLNRFLTVFVCSNKDCRDYTLGLVPALGIGLHSLIDGVIYAVTFNVSILTGALAAIGMVFHEFPEGIVTFVLLERSGIGRRKAAIYAFLAAAISTPIGTLIAFPFISRISRPALGSLLAISAGALVYVGATHLLPAVEKENRRFTLLALAAGVGVAAIIVAAKT